MNSRLVSEQIPLRLADLTNHLKKKKKLAWNVFSDITGRLFSEKQVCLLSKTHFFCSACGSSISQTIYGKIKAYVNSSCVCSLIEPVNMPHMWPDALKCHWNEQECLGNIHTRACCFRFTVIQKKQKYICSSRYRVHWFKINQKHRGIGTTNQTANWKKYEKHNYYCVFPNLELTFQRFVKQKASHLAFQRTSSSPKNCFGLFCFFIVF